MRISPTMLSTYERSVTDWVKTYIGVPDGSGQLVKMRDPQNEAMAAGSAFDAIVKWEIMKRVVPATAPATPAGHVWDNDPDGRYWKIDAGLVEYAKKIGLYLFDQYLKLGAFDALFGEIGDNKPMMEERIHGTVPLSLLEDTEYAGETIEIGGLPDLFWFEDGCCKMFDWKCSQIKKTDCTVFKGYWRMYLPHGIPIPRVATPVDSETTVVQHKDYGMSMAEIKTSWADQLTMYGWLCGNTGPLIAAVDRLVGMPIRVCCYRGSVGIPYQKMVALRLAKMNAEIQKYLDGDGMGKILLSDPAAARAMKILMQEKTSWF